MRDLRIPTAAAAGEVDEGRRKLLGYCVAGAASLLLPGTAFANLQKSGERSLSFYNLHTGETLKTTYWIDGRYSADALAEVNHLLRDYRTGDVHVIAPGLLDLLHSLHGQIGGNKPFHVISGYRSPKTNSMLHARSSGVATHSLHMKGEAIDIRVPGYDLNQLRAAARSLRAGGVGYYPRSDFVHVDVGRVRHWNGA